MFLSPLCNFFVKPDVHFFGNPADQAGAVLLGSRFTHPASEAHYFFRYGQSLVVMHASIEMRVPPLPR